MLFHIIKTMIHIVKFINPKFVMATLAFISCYLCQSETGFLFDDSNTRDSSVPSNITINQNETQTNPSYDSNINSNRSESNHTSHNVLFKKGIKSKLGKLLNIGQNNSQVNLTESINNQTQNDSYTQQIRNWSQSNMAPALNVILPLENTSLDSFTNTPNNTLIGIQANSSDNLGNNNSSLRQDNNIISNQFNIASKDTNNTQEYSGVYSDPSIQINATLNTYLNDTAQNTTLSGINNGLSIPNVTIQSANYLEPQLRTDDNRADTRITEKDKLSNQQFNQNPESSSIQKNSTETKNDIQLNITNLDSSNQVGGQSTSAANSTSNNQNQTMTPSYNDQILNITTIDAIKLNKTIQNLIFNAMTEYGEILQNNTNQQVDSVNVQLLELIDLEVEKFIQKVEGKYNAFLDWLNSINTQIEDMITAEQNSQVATTQ